MPLRVLAALLALALFWSGFSTLETPRAPAVLAQVAAPAVPAGSVEQHHLDDLPVQVQAEPLHDMLLALPPPMRDAASAAGPTSSVALAAWCAPWLDGPLRPPRRAA